MYLLNPWDDEMGPSPLHTPESPQMVENVGRGAAAPGPSWADWARLHQQLAGENARTLQAIMEQLVVLQSQANVKLWEVVAHSMEPWG